MLGRPFQKARRAYCSLKWFFLSSVLWLSSVSLFQFYPHAPMLLMSSSSSPLEAASIHPSIHPTNPKRILLGIFSQVGDTRECQLRHVIRNTYLACPPKHYCWEISPGWNNLFIQLFIQSLIIPNTNHKKGRIYLSNRFE
jgi:hypothetical protein